LSEAINQTCIILYCSTNYAKLLSNEEEEDIKIL